MTASDARWEPPPGVGRYLAGPEISALARGRTFYLRNLGGRQESFVNYHAPDGRLFIEGQLLDTKRYQITSDSLCFVDGGLQCRRVRDVGDGRYVIHETAAGFDRYVVTRVVQGDPERLAVRAPPVTARREREQQTWRESMENVDEENRRYCAGLPLSQRNYESICR